MRPMTSVQSQCIRLIACFRVRTDRNLCTYNSATQARYICRRVRRSAPGQVERLEHLLEREVLAVAEDDHLIRLLAQLALDEAQQVLLVHARAVVHVRVHLRARGKVCPSAPLGSAAPALAPCSVSFAWSAMLPLLQARAEALVPVHPYPNLVLFIRWSTSLLLLEPNNCACNISH